MFIPDDWTRNPNRSFLFCSFSIASIPSAYISHKQQKKLFVPSHFYTCVHMYIAVWFRFAYWHDGRGLERHLKKAKTCFCRCLVLFLLLHFECFRNCVDWNIENNTLCHNDYLVFLHVFLFNNRLCGWMLLVWNLNACWLLILRKILYRFELL